MTSLDCSSDVILLIGLNVLFCPPWFNAVVGIQDKKPRSNPHEKYRGVPKGL